MEFGTTDMRTNWKAERSRLLVLTMNWTKRCWEEAMALFEAPLM